MDDTREDTGLQLTPPARTEEEGNNVCRSEEDGYKSFKDAVIQSSHAYHFHRFPDLPAELREQIWKICLPHRVYEIDKALSNCMWDEIDDMDEDNGWATICYLWETKLANARPPVIASVCRESRAIALKCNQPAETRSKLYRDDTEPLWTDPARSSPHLYYSHAYSADYWEYDDGIRRLADVASDFSNPGASLMLDHLVYRHYPLEDLEEFGRNLAALRTQPRWYIVMRVLVVHSIDGYATADGLFGLLGDAPIQVVDACDEARINALRDLAVSYEHGRPLVAEQRLKLDSAGAMKHELDEILHRKGYPADVMASMRPAVMFRLCPTMCNHAKST